MHVHDSLNLTLCSRSRCGAREAMTVGCKPTMSIKRDIVGPEINLQFEKQER